MINVRSSDETLGRIRLSQVTDRHVFWADGDSVGCAVGGTRGIGVIFAAATFSEAEVGALPGDFFPAEVDDEASDD